MPFKRWNVPLNDNDAADSLARDCNIDKIIARILYNRGYTTVDEMLSFTNEITQLPSPFSLPDMEQAVDRIRTAIDDFEKIGIFGDYDCDGVTSTALLYTYLESVGADVMYLLPTRQEGYGLSMSAVDTFSQNNVSLIITVDNGISAIQEVDYANKCNIDVIITDHHQPSSVLPDAVAVIDPYREDYDLDFKHFAGVGVAFKLVTALENGNYDSTLEQFADILAIGTVGDIVALYGENRLFAQRGIAMLPLTDNLGIKALLELSKLKKINSQGVAFGLVPKINAAGRMGDPQKAVQLLITEDYNQAAELAKEITDLNFIRQTTEKTILSQIFESIIKNPDILNERVLLFKSENFDTGIVGIIASRLVEKYSKPVFMMCEKDGEITGSARSVGEFNLFQALTACKPLLNKFGGHKLAAGFSLDKEKYSDFYKAVQKYAEKNFDIMPQDEYMLDYVLGEDDLTLETAKNLDILEPFGEKNETPLLLIKKARIISVTPLSENKHVKVKISFGAKQYDCLYFGITTLTFGHNIGDYVDLLVNIETNEFNNRVSLSIKIKDIRLSDFNEKAFFNAKGCYEKIKREEQVSPKILNIATPTREDIALVYKYIKQIKIYQNDIDKLYFVFMKQGLNYCKFRLVLDALNDVELIKLSPLLNEVTFVETVKKVDINSARTLVKLHNIAIG